MNKKQLREDIYNELFDSGRIAMHFPDKSLDDRCMSNTNNIMQHVMGYVEKYKAVLEMLSNKTIATWYGGAGVKGGYYASWDDAEYAVRKALEDEEPSFKKSSVDKNLQALLKASSDAVAIQGDRITKAVAYLTGLSMFGTATFQKEIREAIEILQGNDYFTQMQQTEMDSIKASGV